MCGCRRITYLCSCAHKERFTELCLLYQLREERSCFACCFPKCRPHVRRYDLERVCRDCNDYFRRKYGKHHYKKFVDYFLEYKAKKGWLGTAVDPRTVPRNVLLDRQSSGAEAKRGQGQPYQVNQPMQQPTQRSTAPVASRSIMTSIEERRTVQVSEPRARANPQPARGGVRPLRPQQNQVIQQAARGGLRTLRQNSQRPAQISQLPYPISREGTPFPQSLSPSPESTPSQGSTLDNVGVAFALPPGDFFSEVSDDSQRPAPLFIPKKDKPLPTDLSLFAVDEDDDYESSDNEQGVGGVRIFTPSPPPKYNSNDLVPELAHLVRGPAPQVNPELQQPTPRTLKNRRPIVRRADSVSDCSLVKKLTKVAKDLYIPNIEYIDFEGKWVPRILTPPPGKPKSRTPTPSPPSTPGSPRREKKTTDRDPSGSKGTTAIDVAIGVPETLISGKGVASPSAYFVQTYPDLKSPTGSSVRVRRSSSHESVTVPPPRRNKGISIPASARPATEEGESTYQPATGRRAFFKERGLAPAAYIQEECRSAILEKPAPVLKLPEA